MRSDTLQCIGLAVVGAGVVMLLIGAIGTVFGGDGDAEALATGPATAVPAPGTAAPAPPDTSPATSIAPPTTPPPPTTAATATTTTTTTTPAPETVEVFTAPAAFTFRGRAVEADGSFALVDGTMHWFTTCR